MLQNLIKERLTMAHRAYQIQQDNPATSNIFVTDYSVTGIRSYAAENTNTVLITGSCPPRSSSGGIQAMLYKGPLSPPPTEQPTPMTPYFSNSEVAIYSSIFYGPNTPKFFDSNPNSTLVRAVGTYNYSNDPWKYNNGMLYQGPLDGSVSTEYWIKIDMPAANVINTIPHSTMGELIVGNYQVEGMGKDDFNAFVCLVNANGKPAWCKPLNLISPETGQPLHLVTAYGIWKNEDANRPYTIVGGYKPNDMPNEPNVAYLVDYNPSSPGASLKPTPITYGNPPQPILHFEGITKYSPNCYSLAAMDQNGGAAFAIVKRDPTNGSFFPQADWQPVQYSTGSGTPPSGTTTANTVLTNNLYGIFKPTSGGSIQSYVAPNLPPPTAFNCS